MNQAVQKGARGLLLKAALLFSSVDGMVASALMVPLLGSIAMSFPNSSPDLLNQTISLPSLLMIPAIIITGYLTRFFSKKYMLMIGSIIFVASGFGSMFSPNLETLVLFRACEGVGMGIVYPLAPAMIAHLFNNADRAKMIGWSNAAGGVFSFVLSLGAGIVALTNWRNAFYFYLIFIGVVIMQAFLLPAFPPEKKDVDIVKSVNASGGKPKFGYAVYLTVFAMFIFMSIAMVILYNLSIFIMNEKLGTSADAGLSSSLNTVASFIFCVSFGYLFKSLKRYVSLIGLIFMACAYFSMSIAHSIVMVYVGSLFLGAAMGCLFPFLMTRVAMVAPKALKTMAVTLLSMATYVGQWFSGYVAVWIAKWVGGTTRQLFTAVGVIFACFAVFTAVFILATQKNESKIVIPDEAPLPDEAAVQ
jgi:MFS family permease